MKTDKRLMMFSDLESARRRVVDCAKSYYETFSFQDGSHDDDNQEKLEKKSDSLIYAVEMLIEAEKKYTKHA